MKRAICFIGLIGFLCVADEVEYVRKSCPESRFTPDHWQILVQQEPRFYGEFERMVHQSGTTKTTNCYVMVPTRNETLVDGPRTATLDIQWYRNGVFQQMGLRLEYIYSSVGITIQVSGFSICREPAICKKMSIP